MALKRLTEPATLPVSFEDVEEFCKINAETEESLVRQLIETATQSAEAYLGRHLIRQRWQMTMNPVFAQAWSDIDYLSYETTVGNKGVQIPHGPFQELDSDPVVRSEKGSSRPVKSYRLDTSGEQVYLHVDLGGETAPGDLLAVTYWVGYGDHSDDVPESIKTAILTLVLNLYQERGAGGKYRFPLFPVMTPQILSLLSPFRMDRIL